MLVKHSIKLTISPYLQLRFAEVRLRLYLIFFGHGIASFMSRRWDSNMSNAFAIHSGLQQSNLLNPKLINILMDPILNYVSGESARFRLLCKFSSFRCNCLS